MVHHDYVDALISLVLLVLSRVPEQDRHAPTLILQLFEAYQAEIEAYIRAHLPDLEVIAGGQLRQKRDPI